MTLYNPHLLARKELIETFIARQPLLDELVDDLRRGGRQHHVLVGGRGSGKTTLLLRLAAAIEDDKQLAKKCIPLRFPEEQYNVSRPSDLWMNAIDALVDALERQGDRRGAARLEAALVELEPLDEATRAKLSLDVLEAWSKQARRRLALLIDNLDLVLDRLAESLWELREVLSTDNGLVVVGASSKFLEEAIDYQSPFYDFFHVHELGPLSESEARQLVLALAQRRGSPKVAEVLERDPGRFKALLTLTGGTPRTLALLNAVLAVEDNDRVERDLDQLLDQVTPYYKARFDDLPAQSQVIVDKIALHWHPITAAQCQAATQIDLNTVSAQLNRLAKSGVLSKVSLAGPNKLGFQLSERFFNIWYLMRASRRLRRRLSWFVEFLQTFYGEERLQRRAEQLVHAARPDSVDSPAKLLAFAAAVSDSALRRRLEFRAISLVAEQGAATMREVLDLEGEDLHLVPVIDRVQALREIRAQLLIASVRWPRELSATSAADLLLQSPKWPIAIKALAARLASQGNTTAVEHLLKDTNPYVHYYGERLLNAISTGELPPLPDVTSRAELRQIVELASSPEEVAVHQIIYTEISGKPLADELIGELLALHPRASTSVMLASVALMGDVPWPRLRNIMVLTMRHSQAPEFAVFLVWLRRCIALNLAAEAVEVFNEAGVAERWMPVQEALQAIAENSKARFDRLAPEMRTLVAELHGLLLTALSPTASVLNSPTPHSAGVITRAAPETRKSPPLKARSKPQPRQAKRSRR